MSTYSTHSDATEAQRQKTQGIPVERCNTPLKKLRELLLLEHCSGDTRLRLLYRSAFPRPKTWCSESISRSAGLYFRPGTEWKNFQHHTFYSLCVRKLYKSVLQSMSACTGPPRHSALLHLKPPMASKLNTLRQSGCLHYLHPMAAQRLALQV